MDWDYLGHAMWLVQTGGDRTPGLRLLFDPLVKDLHHGGVFRVDPPREIDVASIRADYVIVSHAHPDHFDPRSLAILASLDPETVLLTSDALVADVGRLVGFRDVRTLDAGTHVQLFDASLVTTPSDVDFAEWGVVVATEQGAVFNQIDTVFASPARAREVGTRALEALTHRHGDAAFALMLARWQPLLEVEAQLGMATGFPVDTYRQILSDIAAIPTRCVVGASAGAKFTDAFAEMDGLGFPVAPSRFERDLRAFAPDRTLLPTVTGGRYRVRGGCVTLDPTGSDVVKVSDGNATAPSFRPVAWSPICDAVPMTGIYRSAPRDVRQWVEERLIPGVAQALPSFGASGSVRLALEVVFETEVLGLTIVCERAGVRLLSYADPDYDVLNVICGSMFADVLAARRHWGEPLLSGMLRSTMRAYRVETGRVVPLAIAPIFLYYGLSYDQSVRRWAYAELERRPHC